MAGIRDFRICGIAVIDVALTFAAVILFALWKNLTSYQSIVLLLSIIVIGEFVHLAVGQSTPVTRKFFNT